jgi:hypothetical protein
VELPPPCFLHADDLAFKNFVTSHHLLAPLDIALRRRQMSVPSQHDDHVGRGRGMRECRRGSIDADLPLTIHVRLPFKGCGGRKLLPPPGA